MTGTVDRCRSWGWGWTGRSCSSEAGTPCGTEGLQATAAVGIDDCGMLQVQVQLAALPQAAQAAALVTSPRTAGLAAGWAAITATTATHTAIWPRRSRVRNSRRLQERGGDAATDSSESLRECMAGVFGCWHFQHQHSDERDCDEWGDRDAHSPQRLERVEANLGHGHTLRLNTLQASEGGHIGWRELAAGAGCGVVVVDGTR
jgi:hypothetical protein